MLKGEAARVEGMEGVKGEGVERVEEVGGGGGHGRRRGGERGGAIEPPSRPRNLPPRPAQGLPASDFTRTDSFHL